MKLCGLVFSGFRPADQFPAEGLFTPGKSWAGCARSRSGCGGSPDAAEIRARRPGAKILLFSIFPCGAPPEDPLRKLNEEANALLPGLADGKHIFHRGINAAFLEAKGNPSPDIMPDSLHPNARGNEIWPAAMAPEIERLPAP